MKAARTLFMNGVCSHPSMHRLPSLYFLKLAYSKFPCMTQYFARRIEMTQHCRYNSSHNTRFGKFVANTTHDNKNGKFYCRPFRHILDYVFCHIPDRDKISHLCVYGLYCKLPTLRILNFSNPTLPRGDIVPQIWYGPNFWG